MAYKNKAILETIRSTTPASIGATYAAIGNPYDRPIVLVIFTNTTNGDVFVSDDGVNNKVILPANSYKVLDIRTNAPYQGDFMIKTHTQFYVKDGTTAGTTGTFYIEAVTAELGT